MTKLTKIEKDAIEIRKILDKETLTSADRLYLLSMLHVSYHKSGKIEGILSIDGSSSTTTFCDQMRKAAAGNNKHICNYCYDYRQEQYKANVSNRHDLNRIILSSVRFTAAELATLNLHGICRFNASGEIENDIHAINLFNIAHSNPYCRFTLWTKNITAVWNAAIHYSIPDNLKLMFSNPIINSTSGKAPSFFNYIFSVFTPGKISAELEKPNRIECNGKKCKDCGYKCYMGQLPENSIVIESLRASKAIIEKLEK